MLIQRAWKGFLTYCDRVFSIDLRSLGMFRIALGLIAAWDLALQLPHIEAFYSDAGFFPRSAFDAWIHFRWMANIFELTGSTSIISLIFILGILSSLALALGWKARWMALISWFIIMQTHNRNYFLLQGGDVIIRCCLLYLVFLPSHLKFNFLTKTTTLTTIRVLSGASFLLICQISIIYLFAGLHKNALEWTRYYEAAYNALQIDNYASAFGVWLTRYPELLHFFTKYVVWTEILCGILIFIPDRFFRYASIVIILGLQLGFLLSFNLGTFPWIGSAIAIILLPREFWESKWMERVKAKLPDISRKRSLLTNARLSLPLALNILLVSTGLALWHMNYDNLKDSVSQNTYIRFGLKLVRLDQGWSLFAPNPTKYDGWFVMPGYLKNGEVVDAFRNENLSWDKPSVVSEIYPNHKWRKFMISLSIEKNKYFLSTFSYYLCNHWNKTHSEEQHLEKLEIFWMNEPVVYRGQKTHIEKRPLAIRKCPSNPDS